VDESPGGRSGPDQALSAQIVALDELPSYVGHQKAIAGSGLLLIDLENASSMLALVRKAS